MSSQAPGEPARAPRSPAALAAIGAAALVVFATLLALGTWQVQRLAWKRVLIDRVDRRIHALPVAVPGPAAWAGVDAAGDEYRSVRVEGTFLNDRETLVQAVTRLGGGFWVLTPLREADGAIVLVNRGFVPSEDREPAARQAGQPTGETAVTGLLRMTEPEGAFLRRNDPASGRWYSRDVAAIAAARGLAGVAPFFVDADATPNAGGLPVGGLTVTSFPNDHLGYALTWYALAAMLAGAAAWAVRDERRIRRSWPGRS